jgi:hypothetical protein
MWALPLLLLSLSLMFSNGAGRRQSMATARGKPQKGAAKRENKPLMDEVMGGKGRKLMDTEAVEMNH